MVTFSERVAECTPKCALSRESLKARNVHKEKLSKLEFYVVRILNDGTLAMAKPCNCCSKVLNFCGIKRVWYTTEEGSFRKERGICLENNHVSGGYRRRRAVKQNIL
ncbi:hypothetical protein [Brazilian marseillevirus]|uniref:hypothetical protein n=1 Tax=Brazilian marseillevirus TaxID=1813599 RepID=UPI000781F126|nr:hypothetical protein A3303_gp094 [Brazilian marseillevirus]AMQ10602.1 hypothetical protein [Brazilian marseillevirus]